MSVFTYKSEPLLCAELRLVQTREWEVPSRGEPSTCFAVGVRAELRVLRPASCVREAACWLWVGAHASLGGSAVVSPVKHWSTDSPCGDRVSGLCTGRWPALCRLGSEGGCSCDPVTCWKNLRLGLAGAEYVTIKREQRAPSGAVRLRCLGKASLLRT